MANSFYCTTWLNSFVFSSALVVSFTIIDIIEDKKRLFSLLTKDREREETDIVQSII